MEPTSLSQQFSAYTNWRSELSKSLMLLREWLNQNELGDTQNDARLDSLLERLRGDKLTIAFVAEFSRGKSELINAVFFAEYGQRILPSSAGRTTMCPTELHYDPTKPPSIELLPIETRSTHATVAEYKRYSEEWRTIVLDTDSADAMQEALRSVGEQKLVNREEARKLGFIIDAKGEKGLKPDAKGMVEIPRWRHAEINFPHPLLSQGLVILDTPGLNAIGAEPELTLSLLPNAHAVLFILAADTGVTQSDLAIWRNHVNATGGENLQKGRLVVLNKIDGLWDGLRSDAEIDAEINHQVHSCAEVLELGAGRIFPVSAQKALVAKVNHDQELLVRSRIGELEEALTQELIPAKREIVAESIHGEALDVVGRTRELLDSRLSSLREQLQELTDLRGKNQTVIQYMMLKVKTEKQEFEQGLQQYYAVRSVFSTLTNNLFDHLGMDALREETRRTRDAMHAAHFSKSLREAMAGYFRGVRTHLDKSIAEIDEITNMLTAMYKRFSVQHGLNLGAPKSFSVLRYQKEIDRLEQGFNAQSNTFLHLITTEKRVVTQKFFETVAVQVRRTFEIANREVEHWLRAVMAPLESQVREYQLQLKRRLESVKRIHHATDTLEDRIAELKQAESTLATQVKELQAIGDALRRALEPAATEQELAAEAA